MAWLVVWRVWTWRKTAISNELTGAERHVVLNVTQETLGIKYARLNSVYSLLHLYIRLLSRIIEYNHC